MPQTFFSDSIIWARISSSCLRIELNMSFHMSHFGYSLPLFMLGASESFSLRYARPCLAMHAVLRIFARALSLICLFRKRGGERDRQRGEKVMEKSWRIILFLHCCWRLASSFSLTGHLRKVEFSPLLFLPKMRRSVCLNGRLLGPRGDISFFRAGGKKLGGKKVFPLHTYYLAIIA